MKILLIRNAFRYDYGGGERFPVNLALELRKHGYEPIIVSRSPKVLAHAQTAGVQYIRGWWWSWQSWSGKRVILVPAYLTWQILLTCWYLQLIVRMQPQVVHPQSKDDFIAASLAARLLGKRVIWTDHADLKYVLAKHQLWYKNPVGKLVYTCSRLAASVTLVSHSEAKLIAEQLGHAVPRNFRVIHNGVHDVTARPYPRSKHEQGKFIFCATSRLVVAKGIGELIEAFQQLTTHYPDTILWFVGGGPEEKHFREQASHTDAIRFIGHSEEPLRYVAASDVFVHPSYHEGFSLSLVEAAMLAKPIIACEVGGNVEIVKQGITGLLVPAYDARTLAYAMRQLLAQPTFAHRLGLAARAAYEKQFDFERIVTEQFIPLYEHQ